jgi:hypothetical protein
MTAARAAVGPGWYRLGHSGSRTDVANTPDGNQ